MLRVIDSWRAYLSTNGQDDPDLSVRVLNKLRVEVESGYDPKERPQDGLTAS
jgi:hypothetical protein